MVKSSSGYMERWQREMRYEALGFSVVSSGDAFKTGHETTWIGGVLLVLWRGNKVWWNGMNLPTSPNPVSELFSFSEIGHGYSCLANSVVFVNHLRWTSFVFMSGLQWTIRSRVVLFAHFDAYVFQATGIDPYSIYSMVKRLCYFRFIGTLTWNVYLC